MNCGLLWAMGAHAVWKASQLHDPSGAHVIFRRLRQARLSYNMVKYSIVWYSVV